MPASQCGVEPSLEQAGGERDVGSDLAVARAEAARGIAGGDADAQSAGADGQTERAAGLEQAVLRAHHDVGQVGGALLRAGADDARARVVLAGDVKIHVEGGDRDRHVHVEVVGHPVGRLNVPTV